MDTNFNNETSTEKKEYTFKLSLTFREYCYCVAHPNCLETMVSNCVHFNDIFSTNFSNAVSKELDTKL